MRIVEVTNVKPRNYAAHGLFGSKYLKYHNLRDNRWTVKDLIEQFECLSGIYRRDTEIKNLQREQDETYEAEAFERLREELEARIELLQIVLRGDVKRTKNILINFPNYARMYQNKQSYEVLEELDAQTYEMRKILDRVMGERQQLMNEYETRLMNVAQKQEMIRYYDIKEFQQERDTKRLYVELKNSETRWRAIEKLNQTYKYIIDQLLHDSLFYQPVLEALNEDWNEQSRMLQETYNIGFPTISQVKKLEKNVQTLAKATREDEMMRFEDLKEHRLILEQHQKTVKGLVRRNSDFVPIGDHYTRETSSMMNLKINAEGLGATITDLMGATFSYKCEQIVPRIVKIQSMIKSRGMDVDLRASENAAMVQKSLYEHVEKMMLVDHPDLYKDELLIKTAQLQRAIENMTEKRDGTVEKFEWLSHLEKLFRLFFIHLLDVLRHVDPRNVFIQRTFPRGGLQLPLLDFFRANMPEYPQEIEIDPHKLIALARAKLHHIMQYCNSKRQLEDMDFKYQQAAVEDTLLSLRPRRSDSSAK